MILDASHKNWARGCALLALVATGTYALQAWWLSPVASSGGSVVGLWYGIVGTSLLGFAGLLPLRKWYPLARLGSAQSWLRAHIWLSLLGSYLILLHSSWRWRGTIEQWLMLLLCSLVLSGIWGLVAQHLLTRQLSLQVPRETFYENLPQICRMLQFEGDVLVSRLCETPLPLTPDMQVASDERLKNRGVMGRDYPARLAKVYATSKTAANPAPPAPALASGQESGDKPRSPADKIALMRGKQTAVADSPVTVPEIVVPAVSIPVADTPAAKGISTADKLKLMRAKKPAEEAPPRAAPAAAVSTAAVEPATVEQPLSVKDKMALMRASKKPPSAAITPAADPPAPLKETALPPRPTVARTIQREDLQPFQRDVQNFFLSRVRPFLAWERSGAGDGLHTDASATIVFARLTAAMPAELHEALADLEALCNERRQVTTQARLYGWLQGWLVYVHLPAAAALFGLILVHIAASLYW